jgi:hypothetical protein
MMTHAKTKCRILGKVTYVGFREDTCGGDRWNFSVWLPRGTDLRADASNSYFGVIPVRCTP